MIKNSLHDSIQIELFVFDDDYKTLRIENNKSFDLCFSSEINIEEQIDRLLILLNTPDSGIENASYIDLRFGDKVYIK